MDHLFSPWRYAYVTSVKDDGECVFCRLGGADPAMDSETYVLHRGRYHFIVLNVYPYTSGHLMIVPFEHVDRLSGLSGEAAAELIELTTRSEQVLDEAYRPEGINFGLNLGKCAGAGIEAHLHLHAVPRWFGDTNFMTAVGETRLLPESLEESWQRLAGRFGAAR